MRISCFRLAVAVIVMLIWTVLWLWLVAVLMAGVPGLLFPGVSVAMAGRLGFFCVVVL